MDIKILVAMHKKAWYPSDKVYFPIFVGAAGKERIQDIQTDDIGENISNLNSSYCELTGLYWAWKNLSCDYIGLCHYRRYFGYPVSERATIEEKKKNIFSQSDYDKILQAYDVILPKKRILDYIFHMSYKRYTVRTQWEKEHHIKDLEATREAILKLHPEYINSFDKIMDKHSMHNLNMFVMKKEKFDIYCEWLFSILFEVQEHVDISQYDSYQKRLFGFLGERLLDVWLEKQKLKKVEEDIIFLGEQHKKLRDKILDPFIYKFYTKYNL